MRSSRLVSDGLPSLVAVGLYVWLLEPVRAAGGAPGVFALALVLTAATLDVGDRLAERRRAGASLPEVPALLRRARAGDLPADPVQRRRMAAVVDLRWQARRRAVVFLLAGGVAVALLLLFRPPRLEDLEAPSAGTAALLAVLLLALGKARGLRPARVDLDPDIQALVAEEDAVGGR